MKIKILDNFLDNDYVNEIEKVLSNEYEYFPWYLRKTVNLKDGLKVKNKTIDSFVFTHVFYVDEKVNSNYYDDVINILNESKIKYSKIDRIKANLTTNITKNTKKNFNNIHTDLPDNNSMTLLYYVNNSDGDTIFFDKKLKEIKRITPKKGRAVLFNSNIFHTAQNPIKNDFRIVINYILKNV
tara:strand:- start:60 stop:608 length:549 start_codon:yes stop_codon:yes gene_type:complete